VSWSLSRRLLLVTAGALLIVAAAGAGTSVRPAGITPFWWADGTCETGHIGAPGDGAPRFDWGAHHRPQEGSRYQGFTGFAASTWSWWAGDLGLTGRYPNAYDAPPIIQQRVAHYGLVKYGRWGCMLEHPELMSLPGQ